MQLKDVALCRLRRQPIAVDKRSVRRLDVLDIDLLSSVSTLLSPPSSRTHLAVLAPHLGMHPTQDLAIKVPVRPIRQRLGVRLPPNLDPDPRRRERDLLGHERIVERGEVEGWEWRGRRRDGGGGGWCRSGGSDGGGRRRRSGIRCYGEGGAIELADGEVGWGEGRRSAGCSRRYSSKCVRADEARNCIIKKGGALSQELVFTR